MDLFIAIWQQGLFFFKSYTKLSHRNVLLDEFDRAKVANFGLAMTPTADRAPKGERLAVKWTAPEALFKQKFTLM